jgi:tetratricopeptide (TPR) repeat protein
MTVWQPAASDVSGIQRLAVLGFRGEGTSGDVARSALVSGFWNTSFYTLVDPSPANDGARAGANLPAVPADVAEAVAIGRRLGADAVLIGDVLRYRASDHFNHEERGDDGPGRGHAGRGAGRHHDEAADRDISVAMAFLMIDVRTGKVRVDDRTSYHVGGELLNGQSSLPAKDAVLSQLMERCARDVVLTLTPRQIEYPVELPSPSFGAGWSDMRQGNDYAAKGQWNLAESAWTAALSADPQNHAAMYCLAMAASARSDYPRAVSLLTGAVRLHNSERYQEALARLQRHRQDYDIVMSQKGDRTLR